MARILAFIPDLLFGSAVLSALTAEGHQVDLVADPATGAMPDLLLIDLTAEADERLAMVRGQLASVPSLAFYAHVEADVRERALAAGVDLVVPRSRMAREGPALVARLLAAGH